VQGWPIQVVVLARPIGPCFSCLANSYGFSGDLLALHRTSGSAATCCTMNFSDVRTAQIKSHSLSAVAKSLYCLGIVFGTVNIVYCVLTFCDANCWLLVIAFKEKTVLDIS